MLTGSGTLKYQRDHNCGVPGNMTHTSTFKLSTGAAKSKPRVRFTLLMESTHLSLMPHYFDFTSIRYSMPAAAPKGILPHLVNCSA